MLKRKRTLILITIGLLVILVLAFSYSWNVRQSRAVLIAQLPPQPELASAEPVLREEILEAERRIRQGQQSLEAFIRLTRLYHANGYLNEAIAGYDALLDLQPENPRWPHLLAFILAGYGQLEVAIPLWQATIELAPDYIPAYIRKGDAQLKLNRFDAAWKTYKDVQAKDPANAYAFVGLARLAMHEDDYMSARGYLLDAAANSNNRIGIDLLVTVFEQLGEDVKAIYLRSQAKAMGTFTDIVDPWLNELMDFCYDPYQLISGGGFAAFAGNVERGITLMKRALRFDPDNDSAHFQIAGMYRDKGDLENAMQHFRNAAEINPELTDAWLAQANIFYDRGNIEAGDERLTMGLAHSPNSPGLQLAWGRRLVEMGDNQRAKEAFRKSIQFRPNEAAAYLDLASILFGEGEIDRGRDLLHEALEVEPGHPVALATLAYMAIKLREKERSIHWIQRMRNQPRLLDEHWTRIKTAYQDTFSEPLP